MIADSGVAAVFETARNNMDTSAEEVSVLARVQAPDLYKTKVSFHLNKT